MSTVSKILLMSFLFAGILYVVAGQNVTVHEVTGRGSFQIEPAMIAGERVYQSDNALGDGTVRFVGMLRSPQGQAELRYEG